METAESNGSVNKFINIGSTVLDTGEPSEVPCPSYFDWTEVYPQLQVLIDSYDTILAEMSHISTVLFLIDMLIKTRYFKIHCFLHSVDALARESLHRRR